MIAEELWGLFERELFPVPSRDGLFNQYRDGVADLDRAGAPAVRRQNYRNYLESFVAPPAILLVGEAAGYRGGRFSGVAFTSERQLLTPGFLPFKGQQSSLHGPYSEISGTIVWGELARCPGRAMSWNSVPLHAHRPGAPLSNRTPGLSEVVAFQPLLEAVCAIVKPAHVVALGRRAESALTELGLHHTYVRHPASGGARAFRRDFRLLIEEAP